MPVLMRLRSARGKAAAKLQGRLRPIEADTLQAVTLGRHPATAREAFQMQQDGHNGGSASLTGRWRKVKVRCEVRRTSSGTTTMSCTLCQCCEDAHKAHRAWPG